MKVNQPITGNNLENSFGVTKLTGQKVSMLTNSSSRNQRRSALRPKPHRFPFDSKVIKGQTKGILFSAPVEPHEINNRIINRRRRKRWTRYIPCCLLRYTIDYLFYR
ncbi:hypothetical protein HERIO_598 [Hepatospora eriocheir]|uniref:Uncharacterized protein n=1 Tax=Hepatospora eriocheir TaxID=1081669 RepID=A0A1X0QCU8_9MICR|nr:hypothetical protein HERIO_598 [Hepatospora eriocheir]